MGVDNRNWHRPIARPGKPRIGAVVCLLFPDEATHDLRVVLTQRPDTLKDHSGQVSFPGGRVEEGEAFDAAALRELEEEVGVSADTVTLLGTLAPLYIYPSDFLVHPFVGYTPQRPVYERNAAEVASILEPTLAHLAHPDNQRTYPRGDKSAQYDIPYYDVDGTVVWGATAALLSDWLVRWATR